MGSVDSISGASGRLNAGAAQHASASSARNVHLFGDEAANNASLREEDTKTVQALGMQQPWHL